MARGGRLLAGGAGVGTGKKDDAHACKDSNLFTLPLRGEGVLLDAIRVGACSFTEFAERWLKHVAVQRKPGTSEKYEMILRKYWLPALRRLPVTAVTRVHIKAVLGKKLSSKYKPKPVRGHLDVLRACFSVALEDQLISPNPAARFGKFVTSSGESQETETITGAELTTLLETAEREMPDAYPIVLTLARARLRIGEALTLQADDLDFERHELWVRRTWGSRKKALGDRRITAPKSDRVRRVNMSEQLGHVLQGHLTMREAETIFKGPHRSPWLFLGRDGGAMTPGSFWQNVWRPLLRRSGLRYRKPRTLRHTYARLVLQNRESLAYIRDRLGDHSINLTVDTNGHLVPGANRAAVDQLDDATGRNL